MKPVALALAGLLACALPVQARQMVIVELYTSQGCGSCAEAGELVDELADREDLLPLTFSVDYWDYLGWEDTFARPEFAERQRDYASRWQRRPIYTPQVVVNGLGQARATEAQAVEALIEDATETSTAGPSLSLKDDRVTVGRGAGRASAEVWLIRYDPRGQDVAVRRGENEGRTLTYRNVVRELVKLGDWSGRTASFDVPKATRGGLRTLVVVQEPDCGQVLALLNP